ncbi:cobQ/CobB/MinD/ParA nucleotide binding domain protein [Chlamydia ibidis]|uniref:CobQ/CobB/MinD/ParA nucleotide binding domain protein n=1 Tax=Chlamydia ibidis TaxID=1405396 RepID=S7J4Y9_9CHLA|nr:ParA family protein [Chlamydia ibidis]EPP35489.1 cobQ/CobB/MinD/ParA nucleotide binding domain protein [Chlamydia ibidis]
MKTLAFCSFKGGTGKTTLSLNIGCRLAQNSGKRVLLVDLDPQANLTTGLGIQLQNDHEISNVFRNIGSISQSIYQTGVSNLDIIPSSILVEDFRGMNKEAGLSVNHLSLSLQEVQNKYDICILDTPPSLGNLTKEAFLAAQYLIVCLTPEPFSILGLQKIKEFCSSIVHEGFLEVLGITFSFWDDRNSTNPTYIDIIESIYENKIFSTKIRRDISLSRSLLKETSIFNAYPASRAAKDIANLTYEIEQKLFYNQKSVQEVL